MLCERTSQRSEDFTAEADERCSKSTSVRVVFDGMREAEDVENGTHRTGFTTRTKRSFQGGDTVKIE